ncbi:MAG: hypothetical protein IJE48_09855 [Clostridia bacterium]|nr:hypothetical protein [Clostridia bacterium]
MKRILKKITSFLFAVMFVFTLAVAKNNFTKVAAATITSYEVGDIIEFGYYPQAKITDEALITALNASEGEWISYGYYTGTDSYNPCNGQMISSDYMRYKDVIYNSCKYRGVVFDSYRLYYGGWETSSSVSDSQQDNNGYFINTVYWFKYEPIKWRVLDPNTGMVMSETILDSQAFNNYILSYGKDDYGVTAYWGDTSKTYYSNNYAKSSIRNWLNNNFYNTAFTEAQQDKIQYTSIDNSAYSDSVSAYDSETTYDKIYLLSRSDVLNKEYGFSSSFSNSDVTHLAQGSDYAKSQGLHVFVNADSYTGYSYWRLRTAGDSSRTVCYVPVGDYIFTEFPHNADCTYLGVRPAMNFNLNSEIIQSDTSEIETTASNTEATTKPAENNNSTTTQTQADNLSDNNGERSVFDSVIEFFSSLIEKTVNFIIWIIDSIESGAGFLSELISEIG